MKLKVTKEGRDEVYLVEKEPLKEWVKFKGLKTIHNFIPTSMMMLGADHDVESVLKDIDASERMAILTGSSQRGNMGHALSIIRDNKMEMYDIGKITEDDLEVTTLNPYQRTEKEL